MRNSFACPRISHMSCHIKRRTYVLAILACFGFSGLGCSWSGNASVNSSLTESSIEDQLNDEIVLERYIGEQISTLLDRCGSCSKASVDFVTEPQGKLRGIEFDVSDHASMLVIMDSSEPLYMSFRANLKWDINEVIQAKIGGIQYHNRGQALEVGKIPFQWRIRKGPVFVQPDLRENLNGT
jgi:hypothetical protein